MTNAEIIKGKNYRDEVNILASAKSEITAMALYYYISNEERISDRDYFKDPLIFRNIYFTRRNNNKNNNKNPNYLKYLQLLNEIDDKHVLYIESLLSNDTFSNSKYQEYDINLLLSITNEDIFIDLYELMLDEIVISSKYHKEDLNIISNTENADLRRYLISKATNEVSINSPYHNYDMRYIANLNLDCIADNCLKSIIYYLFNPDGINHPKHVEMLNSLQYSDVVLNHLDFLENNSDSNKVDNSKKGKRLSRIKKIIKKQ